MTETAEQRAERIQRYIEQTHQRFVDSLSLNMPEINTSVMCGPRCVDIQPMKPWRRKLLAPHITRGALKSGEAIVTFDAEWANGIPTFPPPPQLEWE